MPKLSKEQIAARIAALQAKLEDDDGVDEDPATGRWFIVMRPRGATKTPTRRRAPDGSRLRTRDEALLARGQWEAQMASGSVAVGTPGRGVGLAVFRHECAVPPRAPGSRRWSPRASCLCH